MTIEVRQMLITSKVTGESSAPPASPEASQASLAQLRAEVLAECKALIEEKLQRERER